MSPRPPELLVFASGAPPKRVVIYQYPNADAVFAWRHDPAYEEVRKIGEKYAQYRTFAVEGGIKVDGDQHSTASRIPISALRTVG